MFCIEFLRSEVADAPGLGTARGRVTIGAFSEVIEASLEFWDREQYARQWRHSVRDVVAGRSRGCLVTSLTDPDRSNFLLWWPIYRTGDGCHIQNQVLMLKDLESPLDLRDLARSIPDRAVLSEEGEPISEWVVSISELRAWLRWSSG